MEHCRICGDPNHDGLHNWRDEDDGVRVGLLCRTCAKLVWAHLLKTPEEKAQERAEAKLAAVLWPTKKAVRIPDIDPPTGYPESPPQCGNCHEFLKPEGKTYPVTMDLDPGDPEVGPQPDVQEVEVCADCYGKMCDKGYDVAYGSYCR